MCKQTTLMLRIGDDLSPHELNAIHLMWLDALADMLMEKDLGLCKSDDVSGWIIARDAHVSQFHIRQSFTALLFLNPKLIATLLTQRFLTLKHLSLPLFDGGRDCWFLYLSTSFTILIGIKHKDIRVAFVRFFVSIIVFASLALPSLLFVVRSIAKIAQDKEQAVKKGFYHQMKVIKGMLQKRIGDSFLVHEIRMISV